MMKKEEDKNGIRRLSASEFGDAMADQIRYEEREGIRVDPIVASMDRQEERETGYHKGVS